MRVTSEDKLLTRIHKLKHRISQLSSSEAPADPRLLYEVLEDFTNALSEVRDEIVALRAGGKRSPKR